MGQNKHRKRASHTCAKPFTKVIPTYQLPASVAFFSVGVAGVVADVSEAARIAARFLRQ